MRPTALGRLCLFIGCLALVMLAGSALIAAQALDRHWATDPPTDRPVHIVNRLPANRWFAHDKVVGDRIFRLCDSFQPTPRPRPAAKPRTSKT